MGRRSKAKKARRTLAVESQQLGTLPLNVGDVYDAAEQGKDRILLGPNGPIEESQLIDLGHGSKAGLDMKMNGPAINEERNVPDHLISGKEKTVLFQFETWAVIADGDACTIREQLQAFMTALAKTPGHTVTVCNNHCEPCDTKNAGPKLLQERKEA